LIEPAILIIMGIVVVFILISLYLPIFSLGMTGGGGKQAMADSTILAIPMPTGTDERAQAEALARAITRSLST
jgi:hypothetical protein